MLNNRLPNQMTVEMYLKYEQETGIKYEYIDGEIFAMAGGSRTHNIIATNCSGELRQRLRQLPCQSFNSDAKVKISDIKYVYPDFTVVCGEQQYADSAQTMLINPTLVGEVMSPSSADFDQGTKAIYYRGLPTLKAYLLLDQEKPYAQLYSRQEIGWLLQEFNTLASILPLKAIIGCDLPLSEIYLDAFNDSSSID